MGKYIKDVRYILRGGKTIKSIMHNGVEIYNIIDALVEENPDIAPIVSQYPLLRDALEKYPESAAAFQSAKDVITGQSFGNLYKKVVDGTISRSDLESWNIEFKDNKVRLFDRFEENDDKRILASFRKTAAQSTPYSIVVETGLYVNKEGGTIQLFEDKVVKKFIIHTYEGGPSFQVGAVAINDIVTFDVSYNAYDTLTSIYCKIGSTEKTATWNYNFGYGASTRLNNVNNYVLKGFVTKSSKGIEHALIPLSSGMAIDLITGVVYT